MRLLCGKISTAAALNHHSIVFSVILVNRSHSGKVSHLSGFFHTTVFLLSPKSSQSGEQDYTVKTIDYNKIVTEHSL